MKITLLIVITGCLFFTTLNLNLKSNSKEKEKEANKVVLENAELESIKSIFKICSDSNFLADNIHQSQFDFCLDKATQMEHMQESVKFFSMLKTIFSPKSSHQEISSFEFKGFIEGSCKDEKIKDGTSCVEVLKKSLSTNDSLLSKSKKIKEEMLPHLEKHDNLNGGAKVKTFITAFTGVHRFTRESSELIPKLNKK